MALGKLSSAEFAQRVENLRAEAENAFQTLIARAHHPAAQRAVWLREAATVELGRLHTVVRFLSRLVDRIAPHDFIGGGKRRHSKRAGTKRGAGQSVRVAGKLAETIRGLKRITGVR